MYKARPSNCKKEVRPSWGILSKKDGFPNCSTPRRSLNLLILQTIGKEKSNKEQWRWYWLYSSSIFRIFDLNGKNVKSYFGDLWPKFYAILLNSVFSSCLKFKFAIKLVFDISNFDFKLKIQAYFKEKSKILMTLEKAQN